MATEYTVLKVGSLYYPIARETGVLAGKFAATDGTGVGTEADPYSLTAALALGAVDPGETLYLRGGTYYWETRSVGQYGFPVYLQGTAGSPITIRPYPGEHAIIDGGLCSGTAPAHLVIRDLEVLVSENLTQTRTSAYTGSDAPSDLVRPWGGMDWAAGTNIKIINNMIHHNMQGIGFWRHVSGGSMLYGNLIYENGWIAPDRWHGHGIYSQNGESHSDWKYYWNNISINSYGRVAQLYGSSSSYVLRCNVRDNIAANGMGWLIGKNDSEPYTQYIEAHNNFFPYNCRIAFGYGVEATNVLDINATGNRSVNTLETGNRTYTRYSFSDNWRFDNSYWEQNVSNSGVGPDLNPVQWERLLPYGTKPTGFWETCNVNTYDTSRAHIGIATFNSEESVNLTVTGFLANGEDWELYDPTDFTGDPIQSGTCDDSGTISIAMSDDYIVGVLMNRG